jgi:hypothetical protein
LSGRRFVLSVQETDLER